MQKRAALMAVTMLLLAATCLAADITGKWTGEINGPDGNGFAMTFTFKQDGAKLTGSVMGPQGEPLELNDGKVDGDKISFNVKFGPNGEMKIIHEGTIKGDEIQMSSKSDGGEFPPMSFVLKKSK